MLIGVMIFSYFIIGLSGTEEPLNSINLQHNFHFKINCDYQSKMYIANVLSCVSSTVNYFDFNMTHSVFMK